MSFEIKPPDLLASSSSNERSSATVLLLLFLLLLPGIPGIVSGNRATMRRPANDNEGWKAGRKGDQHIRCLQCVREGVRIKQAIIIRLTPKKKSQNKVYNCCCNLLLGRGNHVGWTRSRRERGPLHYAAASILHIASPIFGLHD